jgi:hypothetical protein
MVKKEITTILKGMEERPFSRQSVPSITEPALALLLVAVLLEAEVETTYPLSADQGRAMREIQGHGRNKFHSITTLSTNAYFFGQTVCKNCEFGEK